jgi:hypothetical protein
MSQSQKMTDFPLQAYIDELKFMGMPFEMFQHIFKYITYWAPLRGVSKQLEAHIKGCMDTPTGSTLKAHYKLDANRFNSAPHLLKPGALAEIHLYCRLYQLTRLTVNDVVTAQQFYTFAEGLVQNAVHLTSLSLSNTRFVIERLQPLSRLTNLTEFNMSFNPCLARAQQYLALPPNLRSLKLDSCGMRGMGYGWATQVTGLKLLSLSGNVYQGQDGGYVSRHIHCFSQLQKLELRNSVLELQPLAAILDNVSTVLTSLDIAYNLLGALTGPSDRTALYTALARLTALTELNLAGCFFEGPAELAAAVSAMSALTLLDASVCGLSDPLSADAAAEIAALEARGVRVIR